MKVLITAFLATVIGMVLVVMFRLGSFKEVHVTEMEEGPFYQVYQKHLGPYHLVMPKMEEVVLWLQKEKVPCPITFGEYLDNPDEVDHDRLQSYVGCVVDRDMSQTKLPDHFGFREVPRRRYVVAIFDGAPSIAPYKVYPKAFEYIEKNKGKKYSGPVTEIYKDGGKFETKYLFAID